MGVFIILVLFVLIIYFVVKNNKEKTTSKYQNVYPMMQSQRIMEVVKNVGNNSYGIYWQSFKTRKPIQAKDIETLCDRDMSKVSDKDAFEIVTTLLRWSENAGVPIGKLKTCFLSEFEKQVSGLPYNQALETLEQEKNEEAKQFNISPQNTVCNFMLEFLREKQSNDNTQF